VLMGAGLQSPLDQKNHFRDVGGQGH
jgi:hypothetical protein